MPRRCSRCGAGRRGADLLLCPELQLIGYPPEDLVLKPEFVRRAHECTDELVDATTEPGPAMLIGTIVDEGGSIYNAVILADGGRVLGRTLKRELPNYGTFDEKRIFTPGPLPEPIEFKGVKIGVPICEDIWQEIVCAHLAEAGAEMLLVPNGSPYELDKDDKRYRLVRSRALETALPIAYLNRVGGQDELVFDGSSFIVHPDGERVVQMCDWDEALLITDWERTADGWRCTTREPHELDAFPEDVYRAMMVGPARLCAAQRLSRRDPRPVGRDRQRAVGRGRGGRARPRQGLGRDAPVQIYQRGEPRGRARVRPAARLPP